jgi:hypothetical protein
MHPKKRLSIKSATVAGIAASALLGLAGVTLNPAPAKAVVYCTYERYPGGCIARAGVVLRPRPVARAAVRHNAGGKYEWWRQSRWSTAVEDCFGGKREKESSPLQPRWRRFLSFRRGQARGGGIAA